MRERIQCALDCCWNIGIRDAGEVGNRRRHVAHGSALQSASSGMLWRAVWRNSPDDGKGGYPDHVKAAAVGFRYRPLAGRSAFGASNLRDNLDPVSPNPHEQRGPRRPGAI